MTSGEPSCRTPVNVGSSPGPESHDASPVYRVTMLQPATLLETAYPGLCARVLQPSI
ncbi:hypothetical protein DPMN_121003 [Dreissena polymorpha]|uniref:Uncharacterized protein n=1 Tax=Dreissena polymorpha TaxID=45954 RepID=A0A9D4GPP4_DREPO|nr:hypothetical protein DPMN_121003 [Dreissena polymorpha]